MTILQVPSTLRFRATLGVWSYKPNPNLTVKKSDGTSEHPRRLFFKARPKMGNAVPSAYRDPWAVRELFLQANTEEKVFAFLAENGQFSALLGPGIWDVHSLRYCQEAFRFLLQNKPPRWNKWLNERLQTHRQVLATLKLYESARTTLNWNEKHPVVSFEALDSFSAIYYSIYLDHVRGAQYKFCARSDCAKPFELTSRHVRKYCSQYCAHLETVRRLRSKAASNS
jgi:hypothetical protein